MGKQCTAHFGHVWQPIVMAYSQVSIQYFNDTAPITQVAELIIISTRTIAQLVGNHRRGVIKHPRLM
jgi:hypothetical protein